MLRWWQMSSCQVTTDAGTFVCPTGAIQCLIAYRISLWSVNRAKSSLRTTSQFICVYRCSSECYFGVGIVRWSSCKLDVACGIVQGCCRGYTRVYDVYLPPSFLEARIPTYSGSIHIKRACVYPPPNKATIAPPAYTHLFFSTIHHWDRRKISVQRELSDGRRHNGQFLWLPSMYRPISFFYLVSNYDCQVMYRAPVEWWVAHAESVFSIRRIQTNSHQFQHTASRPLIQL